MKKEEIDGFIEDRFKGIVKYLRKVLVDFEPENICLFRNEIEKLQVFLHLLCMESADGCSYRITKRMKTIYGYFGIFQNLQQQLRKTNEFLKKYPGRIPVQYVAMLEKEQEFWKKTSKDFIDADYDFFIDKKEILTTLPDKLTKKSILKFIHYTLFELQSMSCNSNEYILESTRKIMGDIYYNYEFIKPFISESQTKVFDKKTIDECMKLFSDFRDESMMLAHLQTFAADKLDEPEKQFLKEMENDWLLEKNDLKNQLSAKLDSMHI